MCYDTAYLRHKQEKYEKRYGIKNVDEVRSQLPITYHVNGYRHPNLPVITKEDKTKIQAFNWGLIPFFIDDPAKATARAKFTLNARGETIFEVPSYRPSAPKKRCAILLDGFFEHQHQEDGTTTPHYIQMTDGEPFYVGGLYSYWNDRPTVSLITTKANELMREIHNGGKNPHRMPYIIPDEQLDDWLTIEAKDKASKDQVLEMIGPYDTELMEAYPVGRLRGKAAIGNKPEVLERV